MNHPVCTQLSDIEFVYYSLEIHANNLNRNGEKGSKNK